MSTVVTRAVPPWASPTTRRYVTAPATNSTADGATTLTTVADTGRGVSSSASRRRTRICAALPSSTSTTARTAVSPCRTMSVERLEVGGRIGAVTGPRAVGDVHDPETGAAVGVPNVTASRVECRRRHRVRAAARRHVEVGHLTRLTRVADVEHPQAGQDHAARHDARVVLTGDGAVVRGITLRPARCAGVVLLVGVAGVGVLSRKPDPADDLRLLLVPDVDDAGRTDAAVGVVLERIGAELVELHQVGVVLDRDRDDVLRDADLRPRQLRDDGHAVGRRRDGAVLDLGDVEDDQATGLAVLAVAADRREVVAARGGEVGPLAILGDRHPVRAIRLGVPDDPWQRRRGEVDRGDALARRGSGPERAAVR